MAPAEVSGSWEIDDCVYDGTVKITRAEVSITDQGVAQTRGLIRCASIEADDQRLSAENYFPVALDSDTHFPGDSRFFIESAAIAFANDGGSWVGASTTMDTDPGGAIMIVLTGTDGYEGLTAILVVGPEENDGEELDEELVEEDEALEGDRFVGVIFPGEVPPVPEPYSAE